LGDFWVTQFSISHLHIDLADASISSTRVTSDHSHRYSKCGNAIAVQLDVTSFCAYRRVKATPAT
jgi:hypothetical protein